MDFLQGSVRSDMPLEGGKIISMEEETKWLEDSVAPFLKLTQAIKGIKPVGRMEHKHRVRKLLPLAHTTLAAFSSGGTTLTVTNPEAFIANDAIYVPSLQKFFFCATTPSSGATTIAVRKKDAATGTGPDFNIANNTVVLNLMESHAEGAAVPVARTVKEEEVSTYIYQYDELVKVTDIENSEQNYGNEKTLEKNRKAQQLSRLRALEMMFISGANMREVTSGSGARRHLPAGLEYYLYSTATDASAIVGGLTLAALANIIRPTKAVSSSSDEKLLMSGTALWQTLSAMPLSAVQIEVGENKTWGITVNRLVTAFGNFKCLYNPLLAPEYDMGDRAFVLDTEYIQQLELQGNPARVIYDMGGSSDVHNISDLLTGTRGLEVIFADTLHKEIINITGS
jgi:hypothetical protein